MSLFCVTLNESSVLSPCLPPCSQKLLRSPRKPTRKISKIPFKVLDAPELQDDFYLNLVDWSSLNVLSVGLGTCVYLWSACTSQVCVWMFVCYHTEISDTVSVYRKCLSLVNSFIWCELEIDNLWIVSFGLQVTRLCDLSVEGDSVTSVGWSERVCLSTLPPICSHVYPISEPCTVFIELGHWDFYIVMHFQCIWKVYRPFIILQPYSKID